MLDRIAGLIRRGERAAQGYSRGVQAARVRASYQRAYFAPALFTLVPVRTELIASMAVDTSWRLYYNDRFVSSHTVEENAAILIHEVSHLLRDHEKRRHAAGGTAAPIWNTAADCEINDDLLAEGLPLPGEPPHPEALGLTPGQTAERYYRLLTKGTGADCGSGAHGERRPWELPDDDGSQGGAPGVDSVKAELVRRDVAQKILDTTGDAGDVPAGWRLWARSVLTPRVDYMATIRHAVRKALRESTLGRYDRTYRRPSRRQAAYGDFLMPSFHQPRPTPGFLIDTSNSMQDAQLSRAVAELGGLTRQLGYGGEVLVACCDVAVHDARKVFSAAQVQLYGGGGTDLAAGLRWFTERRDRAVDLLVVVTDCCTPWPLEAPPFPVITVRVGDGLPPPWGETGHNRVITIGDA